ncbi:kinase-like protein [Thelephora ganbajun]|uniref:Kinase-like protein n=1 Tax=Thelephora ganbajun TaxID=370292 RepID=A0ACB6Z425_THEGA|nr:kinase-like protein [Thelephora ganbajun]
MGQPLQSFPASINEDFVKLGIEPQHIPFILATISRTEQLPSGSPPLSPREAKELVEILDKAVSSKSFSQDLKERFSKILCQVCRSNNVLPTSYSASGVVPGERHALGAFADIYKGQYEGKLVCIKAFRTQTTKNMELIKRRLHCEILGWKHMSHPNVLPFLGISEIPPPFCIISPWMPNGNIVEYTKKNRSSNRLLLLSQSACGLQYLHSLDIVHSDINPGNILVTEEGVACLADFGISGIVTDPSVVAPGSTTTSKGGLVRYMAPEQMNPSRFGRANSNPSKESDVHSLAMTAYEVTFSCLTVGTAKDFLLLSGPHGDQAIRRQ